jgi:hypothetical protein
MPPVFRHGKGAFFSLTNTAGSVINLSSGVDSVSQDRTVETADVTTFGDNDRNFIPGLRTGAFSVSGHMSSTHAQNIDALLGHSTLPSFVYGPHGNTTGGNKRKYTGTAIVTQLSYSAEVGGKVSFSMNLQTSGAITSTHFG